MSREPATDHRKQHWETVHETRSPESASWYQKNPALSLQLIAHCDVGPDAPIIDVGGGSASLVDHLQAQGYTNLTVLDISDHALALAQRRLGSSADDVSWLRGDATRHNFTRAFDVWHDRAAFHFLTRRSDQQLYVDQMRGAVASGGFGILATFGLDGPSQCSGLPVSRYSTESMSAVLGQAFEPVAFATESHTTPAGAVQHFLYGCFRRT